jgi:glycosyltransferase involved in cell wall biosynthesis
LKVVFITGFFDEDFYYREHAYAEYLDSRKVDYLIFTSKSNLPQKNKSQKIIDSGKFKLLRFPSIVKFKDLVLLNYLKNLKSFSPDIIHVFDAQQAVGILAIMWAKKNGVPVVYDHELQRVPISFFGKLRYYLVSFNLIKFCINHSDIIRLVTPASLNLLYKISKVDLNKIKLEHLGYSDNFIQNPQIPFVLEENVSYIMTSGFFDCTKNIESIVSGFLLFWRRNKQIRLLIIGPIENQKVIRLINNNNSIVHYNQFLNIEQLNYLYSKIKIHIWPKSTASIFEALKFDNYVILKLNDDTSHLISNQIKLLDVFNLFTISKKIEKVIYEPLISDNLKFSYKQILERLYETYENLLLTKK